jgi:hypothetical protein
MYEIEMHAPNEQFSRCWNTAARHLQSQVQDGLNWLKCTLAPPFLEHLSFRLGNQLYFVRIEATNVELVVPGSRNGLMAVAEGCNGHACIMPMTLERSGWTPVAPGWGLLSLQSGKSVDPLDLITDELIEMTDWELHDFAVQVVRDHLKAEGKEIGSTCGNPQIDPAIWFMGDNGPEWVVVRAVRFPEAQASVPGNISGIIQNCKPHGTAGHFASVSFANAKEPFSEESVKHPMPLWRGHGMYVNFAGLEPLSN